MRRHLAAECNFLAGREALVFPTWAHRLESFAPLALQVYTTSVVYRTWYNSVPSILDKCTTAVQSSGSGQAVGAARPLIIVNDVDRSLEVQLLSF